MASPFENLRLRNIFQPSMVSPGGNVGGVTPPDFGGQTNFSQLPTPSPDFDPTARMRELYQPEEMAGNRYNQLMQGRPEYEKPGFWRAAAGALSAFGPGGHDIGMKVANWNNDRRLSEWKENLDAAAKAASLENTSNVNARTLAHQTVQNEVNLRRNEATARHNEARDKIAADRAEVYRLKSTYPNYKFDYRGPKVIVSDPKTGQSWTTNVDTGNLSETDKLEKQHEQRLEQIDATGANRISAIEAQGEITGGRSFGQPIEIRRPDGTVEYYQPTVSGPPRKIETPEGSTVSKVGTGEGGGESATQTTRRHYNNAKEFVARNPTLAKWIKFGRGNTVQIVDPYKPTGGWTDMFSKPGPTEAEHKQIADAIYGPPGPTNARAGTTQTQTATPQIPQGAKPGGTWKDTKYGKVYIEP